MNGMSRRVGLPLVLAAAVLGVGGCAPRASTSDSTSDSAFAAVQARGRVVMGVDQYTSQHVFEDLPDGGRIVLERDDVTDSAAIAAIRAHMREIAAQFANGDFTNPSLVHAQEVPGTRVMRARRAAIRYSADDRPRGAEVRIVSGDSAAVRAIHEFLAFQRSDHRAGHRH